MSTFGDDLIRSLKEAVAHAEGQGPGIVHEPVSPRTVREQAKLTQAQMAPLMGMSLSGYRKWEQGTRRVSGPAATLLRVIQKEPEAVRRALLAPKYWRIVSHNNHGTERYAMAFPVTNLISSAFTLASSEQSEVKKTWISISHGVGSLLPDSLLVTSIQRAGDLDVLLRCLEEERAPCVSKPQSFEEAVHLTFHYQVLLSELWISITYEMLRLLKDRALIEENLDFFALEHDFRLIRVPIDKHEIAKDRKLDGPLTLGKFSSSGETKDYYTYERGNPRRAHIMAAGITPRGSITWNALDVEKPKQILWLERLNLSDRTLSILQKLANERLQKAGAKM